MHRHTYEITVQFTFEPEGTLDSTEEQLREHLENFAVVNHDMSERDFTFEVLDTEETFYGSSL